MFRTLTRGSLVATVLLTSAVSVQAGPVSFDDIDVEFWTGSGSNEAIVVVDWKTQADRLYAKAFGYRWDGTKTGRDLLNDLNNADTFYRQWDPTLTDFIVALGWDASGDGVFDPADPNDWFESGYGFPGAWAHLRWLPDGDGWVYNGVQVSDPLVPGQLDGWSWDANGPPPDDVFPDVPNIPTVPEPATCLLVGLGLAILGCTARRRLCMM